MKVPDTRQLDTRRHLDTRQRLPRPPKRPQRPSRSAEAPPAATGIAATVLRHSSRTAAPHGSTLARRPPAADWRLQGAGVAPWHHTTNASRVGECSTRGTAVAAARPARPMSEKKPRIDGLIDGSIGSHSAPAIALFEPHGAPGRPAGTTPRLRQPAEATRRRTGAHVLLAAAGSGLLSTATHQTQGVRSER